MKRNLLIVARCMASIYVLSLSITVVSAEGFKSSQQILEGLSEEPKPKSGSVIGDIPLRGLKPVASTIKAEPAVNITILFESGSAEIRSDSQAQVQEIARALKQLELGQRRVMLVGHTDSRGSESYNLALSQQRASAVKEILIRDYAIPSDKLISDGRGEKEPVVSGEQAPEHYAKNRRVELRLVEDP